MIINVRGTSGSGKSTLIREVMSLYGPRTPSRIPDRKQPIGYVCERGDPDDQQRGLLVPGHYETACGGCDTITNMEEIFNLVRNGHGSGMDVLFEGLLISADFNRTFALHKDGLPLLVIGLTKVPLEVCAESILQRKQEKADKTGRPPKPTGPNFKANLESKWKGTKSTCAKLASHGVRVVEADRTEALALICQELAL